MIYLYSSVVTVFLDWHLLNLLEFVVLCYFLCVNVMGYQYICSARMLKPKFSHFCKSFIATAFRIHSLECGLFMFPMSLKDRLGYTYLCSWYSTNLFANHQLFWYLISGKNKPIWPNVSQASLLSPSPQLPAVYFLLLSIRRVSGQSILVTSTKSTNV